MMGSWWFFWFILLFVLVVPPLGYGWSYRGWGPPYPRYIQRRRGQRAAAGGASATFNHEAWGRGGDFVWMVIFIGAIWAMSSIWLRR